MDRDFGDEEDFDIEDCKICAATLVRQRVKAYSACKGHVVCLCLYSVDEGPVFAMCMTGQGDQATLNHWISGLQENNPILGHVPTLFRLSIGPSELQDVNDSNQSGHQSRPEMQREGAQPEEEAEVIEEEPRRSQGMKQ